MSIKYLYNILLLILITYNANSQSLKDFSYELSNLKSKYRNVLNNNDNIEDFKDAAKDVHSDVSSLSDEIEDAKDELGNSSEYQNLLNEISDFEDFTEERSSCECLYHFNKFIRELGGSSSLLKEENGVKVSVVRLGKFNFYYAYAVKNYQYSVSVEMSSSQGGYSSTSSKSTFGLVNEIEVFDISITSDSKTISSVVVNVSSTNSHTSYKCRDDFPRE